MVEVMASEPAVMRDADLLARARAGEAEALEQVVRGAERYVWWVIQRLRHRHELVEYLMRSEPEDVYQIAIIGLIRAIRSYRPERGAAFSTWAGVSITHTLLTHVRYVRRRHLRKGVRHVSLDELLQHPGAADDTEIVVWKRDAIERLRSLSDRDRMMVLLRAMGYTIAEISSSVGVSPSTACRVIHRAATTKTRGGK